MGENLVTLGKEIVRDHASSSLQRTCCREHVEDLPKMFAKTAFEPFRATWLANIAQPNVLRFSVRHSMGPHFPPCFENLKWPLLCTRSLLCSGYSHANLLLSVELPPSS